MRLSFLRKLPWLLALACAPALAAAPPPAGLKVAFIGDQGLGPASVAVLQLIEDEGADAVIHAGDFDYGDDPAAWDAQIDATLGSGFPYFALIGNHDDIPWYIAGGYQERIAARMLRLGIPWDGDLGVKSAIHWQGLHLVMTAPGIFELGDPIGEYEDYIRDEFAGSESIWRISSWHKLMRDMQVGAKIDETGWGVYEASREAGAIVATAHEHSYSRTHLMSDFDDQVIASTDDPLVLAADDVATGPDEGRSFAFVSGLGGRSIRNQVRDEDWWASVYTGTQDATDGALFAVFHVGGNPRLASFYFKDVDGNVIDTFTVESTTGSLDPVDPFCGDGAVDAGEACDDGNTTSGDGCDAVCQNEAGPGFCGDGIPQAGEECDDGNTTPGDGCGPLCQHEPIPGVCGDGIVHPGEECDDGNTAPGDGCSELCLNEAGPGFCGDGILQVGEECDDGDVLAGDGCDALCQHEPIPGVCGDGIVHPGEECDDGNTAPGDGCSELCLNEAGPGFCGDGILQVGEECDDGNTLAGDGCDALCQLEASPSGCAAAPIAGCLAAAKASLTVTETKTGREKLKARLEKFGTETSPSSFGDPATGATRYDLCLYDAADSLAAALTVDRAGESCGPKQKPCFKAKGSKGWQYADTDASASGTKKLAFSSGTSGNGKISWIAGNRAKKGQQALPSGIAAALEGTASVHLQLATSGAECFEAELGDIRKDDGFTFKAR